MVRDDIGQIKPNVFAKRAQHDIVHAIGGVQLSIDVSTAF